MDRRSSTSTVTQTEEAPPREVITMEGKGEKQATSVGTYPDFKYTRLLNYSHMKFQPNKRNLVWDNDVPNEMRQMLRARPPVIMMLQARFAVEKEQKKQDDQKTAEAESDETTESQSLDEN